MNDIFMNNETLLVAYKPQNKSLTDYETELKERFKLTFLKSVYPLDKLACGIVVLAKDEETFSEFTKRYSNGELEFTFFAVVVGESEKNSQVFNAFLSADKKTSRLARVPQLNATAKHQVVEYSLLQRVKQIALVKLKAEQFFDGSIRFACFDLGTPIFGDNLYGGDSLAKNTNLSLILGNLRFKQGEDYLNFVAFPNESKPWSYFDVEKYFKIH